MSVSRAAAIGLLSVPLLFGTYHLRFSRRPRRRRLDVRTRTRTRTRTGRRPDRPAEPVTDARGRHAQPHERLDSGEPAAADGRPGRPDERCARADLGASRSPDLKGVDLTSRVLDDRAGTPPHSPRLVTGRPPTEPPVARAKER